MPLDQNLFTLSIHSRPNSVGWLDLVVEHSNGRDIERMYSAFKVSHLIPYHHNWQITSVDYCVIY